MSSHKNKEHKTSGQPQEEAKQNQAAEAPAQTLPPEADLAAEQAKKIKELEERYLRLFAEFDNYRKRTQLEKEELSKYAGWDIIKNLLPIMDSFEQAKQSFEKHNNEIEDLKKGLALIHKLFEDTLEKMGVTKIVSKGEKFDPELHEAIMQQEAAEVESGTIIEEMRTGFRFSGKVLRHSMVIVAK